MTRTMYDGITAAALPADATMVAGYVDGDWPDADALAARFPHALVVRIATSAATNDGIVLDVENGDATAEEAVSWVLTRRHAGLDPSVYCGQTAWPQVRAAFDTCGVPEPHWWVAQYDGIAALPSGTVAKQYKTTAGWDESIVADYWPGVDPEPNPAPEEEEMGTTSVNGRAGLSWQQGTRHLVQVTYDPAAGDPDLRVVLALTTGPLVLWWALAKGSGQGSLEFGDHTATCCGVILEGPVAGPVYDAIAL